MQAVALDLDGTLLNSEHKISSYSKEILMKLDRLGIKIVLSSARPIRSVLNIAHEIGLQNLPMIAANGAIIAKNEKEILYRKSILKNDFQALISFVNLYLKENSQYEMTMHIYSEFKWLVPFYTEKAKNEVKIINFDPDIIGKESFDIESAEKIMFVANPEYLENFAFQLKKIFKNLTIVFSKSDSLEINTLDVSKYLGLLEVSKLYNIDIKNFIAIGDGDNDESMILNCGYGVAMSNASIIAKRAADQIILSNDEDGVAKFLEGYFLKQN